ncbi:MAG: TolC family protein, partial [bacterium]
MTSRKILSLIIAFSIININLLPVFSWGFLNKDKQVLNAQVSEYKFDYINLAWWESFDDKILKGYIVKAVEQNQDLKIATLKVEEYNQLVKLQFAKELPSASISPGIGSLKMAGADGSGIFNFPLVVNYEADVFLKNRDKTKSAKKQFEASKFDEKAAYIAIASAVASTYLNLVKVDKLIVIQNDIISYKEQIYNLMMTRNQQGITSTADTVKANKELILAQTDLIELEKSKNILSNKLAVLIGESPMNAADLKRIAYDDLKFKQEIPQKIPSEIIIKRPDVLRAEKQLEKAGIDVKIARKEFLPVFNILGLMVFSSSSLSGAF